MNWLRLWLASIWLVFAAVAPAHAASMAHATCDHMTMPHAPARHLPAHDNGAMPCCSVPPVIAAAPEIILPERTSVFVGLSPVPVHQLDGMTAAADPRPPKKAEV